MIIMELVGQRRLAAKVMKCGKSRVWMDPARLGDIAQAITTQDIGRLVKTGFIKELPPRPGINRAKRAHIISQKQKGRRKGKGSRKGGMKSRFSRKKSWISIIRSQRKLLKELLAADKIDKPTYKNLYAKAGGGFFRSRAHLLTFVGDPSKIKKSEV